MKIKDDTVLMRGIRAELLIAVMVADAVYREHDKTMVITSCNDSKHGLTSLHYAGAAIDLRSRYFSDDEKYQVAEKIRERLNKDYDVVVEDDHLHVEFQPKGRK